MVQRKQHAVVCACIVQCSRVSSARKFLEFESIILRLSRPPNHVAFMATGASVTQVIRYGDSSELLPPSESAFVFEALQQNCLLAAVDLGA